MTSYPMLALTNFRKPFELHCDASREGIGVVILQEKHPITYERRKLTGTK